MDDSVQKSCWGITGWTVAGVACIMVLAWLLGGPQGVETLASATG